MWEYAIIPITFKYYSDYVDTLDYHGSQGWIFGAMIRAYENSPTKGHTTHDFICRRAK